MDQELQKLIRQLKEEKCPPAVLERVAERISREKTFARSLKASFGWAVAIACLLLAFSAWQWRAQKQRDAAVLAAQAQAGRAVIAQQTHEAFAYIAQAVMRAAAHAENTLSKEAVPPLRESFETVKNKVTKPI